MDFNEIECVGVDCSHVAQEGDKWQGFVKILRDSYVP
jgi:hypothetical protein